MFEELNAHRAAVAENIQKAAEIGFTGGELEKAHKVGDIHPNGKWVWTQLPSGKYDWRVIKKTGAGSGAGSSSTAQKTAKKEDELWGFVNILKQTPNERHLEQMSVDELKRFRDAAHKCWLDDENLNRLTRVRCRDWRDLAKQEIEYRANEAQSKKEAKKEFHIGSKITNDNAENFVNRINNGELHVVNTRGKSQNYVVTKAGKPYYENGKCKIQLTFKYIGNDKNNVDYPDGTDYDDFSVDELNNMYANSKISIALKKKVEKPSTAAVKKKAEKAKVPSGHRIYYEDDLVEVYDDKGKKVYSGLYDYCDYKDEVHQWNRADQNYDLPHGYKLVGKTKH